MAGDTPANSLERRVEAYDWKRLHAARKQSAIMSMFDGLQPGQAFSVLLGFDPGRLKGQFEAFFGDDFAWVLSRPWATGMADRNQETTHIRAIPGKV
ncbi:MAG: DUF2249 domain-containing protein [Mesorhizobium sp.]|uniref:DUF2249 domain-containing protein n=1 Tax=Mesorhizobium sp. TaxID=1871066 RepID=UPI001212A31D|nr:DUF2249 domain-containing protein [Mesorhizobium sp.]TIO99909.1 MAG: DUF2249 domain-containing protein [Mesorhizobium sp.]